MKLSLLGFLGLRKKDTVEENKGTVTDICTPEAALSQAKAALHRMTCIPRLPDRCHLPCWAQTTSISLTFEHSFTAGVSG